ncbi:MAG: hypothetical protein RLZZ299_1507 [Pseudomonadota bacterium]
MALEEPAHEVLQRWGDVELRRYRPLLVAETRVEGARDEASSEGFRRLAGYIFGNNRPRGAVALSAQEAPQRIAMTAPVAQAPSPDGAAWTLQFTMPAAWTLETLPTPEDPRVRVRACPERRVLTVRYRGSWTEARRQAHEAILLDTARREGLRVIGPLTWARYDPPWMPWFLKRNEIWVDVAP